MRYAGYPYEKKDLYFSCVTSQTNDGPYTKTYYNQTDYRLAGKIESVEDHDANGKLMKLREYDYTISTPYTRVGVTSVQLGSQKETTYELDTSGAPQEVFNNTKTYSYDNDISSSTYSYGNPTTITEHSSDSGLSDIVTVITYDTVDSAWVLGNPADIKTYKTSTSGTLYKWKKFTYNANKKLATKSDYTGTKWITTSYAYDAYGNLASTTSPNAAGGTSTTTITYDDTYHTFPVKMTDAIGEINTTYDPATGNKLTVEDYNHNIMSYEYDTTYKNRLVRVFEPFDTGQKKTKEIFYNNWTDPATRNVEVRTYYDDSGKYYSEKEYSDGLNRKYKTISTGYSDSANSIIYNKVTDYTYDNLGRLKAQTNPYLEGCDDVYFTVNVYDAAGRVIEKRYGADDASGSTYDTNEKIAYIYSSGLQIVKLTDKNGNFHTSYYNSRGSLTCRKDIGKDNVYIASVLYVYDIMGRLKTTQGTNIYYDMLGRKTKIIEPNTGTTSYTYKDSGQIATQTDARGIVLNYSYDTSNRLTREWSSDATIDTYYYYDSDNGTGNNLEGRLARVTDTSGDLDITTEFSYDKKGNVTQYTKRIDKNELLDEEFAVETAYDYQGRVTSTTYPDPDHSVVKRHYADSGYLKAVTDADNKPYVQYSREKETDGTPICSLSTIERITGNGVTTTITYDPVNLRPLNVMTWKDNPGDSDDAVYENVNYTHDSIGNILGLEDINTDPVYHTVNETESFAYDNLSRLTYANAPGMYGAKTYSFGGSGNLTVKDGLAMTYGSSSHPQAVTAFNGKTYSYDASGNMTDRNGRTFVYDAKNRLVEVETEDGDIEKYTYDYTGFRIRKELSGGTVVYNVNGLYELTKVPDNTTMQFTRFIYGMDGELAAQIRGETTSSASIYPVTQNMYRWKSWKGFFLKIYAIASAWIEDASHTKYVFIFLFGLSILTMLVLLVYNIYFRTAPFMLPAWITHTIPIVLISFFALFGLPGCFDGLFSNVIIEGIYYYHPNQVGSVKFITNDDGTDVVARYHYDPYGALLTSLSTGTEYSKYKYTAQELDSTTGLYYYNARFYDPAIGRFISADSIVPDPNNTQAFNRYMYAYGNPIKCLDPTGHASYDPSYVYYYYFYNCSGAVYNPQNYGYTYYSGYQYYPGNMQNYSSYYASTSDPSKTPAGSPAANQPAANQNPVAEKNNQNGGNSKAGNDVEKITEGDEKNGSKELLNDIAELLKQFAKVQVEYKREISIFGLKFSISDGITLYGEGKGAVILSLNDGSKEYADEHSLGAFKAVSSASTSGLAKSLAGIQIGTIYNYLGLTTDGYTIGGKVATGEITYAKSSVTINPITLAAILVTAYTLSPSASQNINQVIGQLQYAH